MPAWYNDLFIIEQVKYMASTRHLTINEEFFDFLVGKAKPEEIIAFQISEEAKQRARELIERNNEGILTPVERAELDQMLEFERMFAVLKAKALKALNQS